jgi:hypothetical protein
LKQRIWLESKVDLKKRLSGKSPDDADALALTFAAPVLATAVVGAGVSLYRPTTTWG